MLDLTLTNRVLSASEAEAWRLVNRVVPDDEVDEAAGEIAHQLANGASWTIGQAKRVIYSGYEMPLEQAAELEGVTITSAMARHDGREGVAAFVEKRRPHFTGD
jgi:2-(1,2-epoxy-1,2-dihydrophenyl)acetyl-CoA isomerase